MLKGKNHELECQNAGLMIKLQRNDFRITNVANTLTNRSETIEDLQQYTRRNCVIVTGIPEEVDEKTDDAVIKIASEMMELPLEDTDIDRSHRIGRPRNGKARPVVVKFARYNTRQKFMLKRTKLKGSKLGVQDLLTPFTQHLLQKAKELVEQSDHVTAAWTWDGRVMVLVKTESGRKKKIHITSHEDCHNIFQNRHPGM
jgi:hypothetical protein